MTSGANSSSAIDEHALNIVIPKSLTLHCNLTTMTLGANSSPAIDEHARRRCVLVSDGNL